MLDSILYRVPQGDQFFPIWARARMSLSSAATTVGPSWQNTQQLPFKLEQFAGLLTPGAAQYVTAIHAFIADQDGTLFADLGGAQFSNTVAAQVVPWGVPLGHNVIVPPRYYLVFRGYFNAGAASNSVVSQPLGWFIPRGSMSLP